MSAILDSKQISRRAWRDSLQDGLTDLFVGIVLILMGVTLREGRLVIVIALFVIFGKRLIDWLQARITTPRTGYARFSEDKNTGPVMLVLIGIAVLLVFSILAARGALGDAQQWYRGLTLVPALMLSGGFLMLGGKSGLARFYLYAVLSLAGGGFISTLILPGKLDNISLFLAFTGIVPLLWGLGLLIHFLRCNPVLPEDARNAG